MANIITGLKNCHAHGVDSIILGEKNGRLKRAFIARENHHLGYKDEFKGKLQVGFHAHHCDITIKILTGVVYNRIVDRNRKYINDVNSINLDKYLYTSPITKGGKGKFDFVENVGHRFVDSHMFKKGDVVPMKAKEEHTIYVPSNSMAIWILEEGEEDPNYIPYTYSNKDLTKETFENMYIPMTESEVWYAKSLVESYENK